MSSSADVAASDNRVSAADGAVAHALHQQIIGLRRTIERDFLQLGAFLARMRDERLYEPLGYDTFTAYLGDPELGLGHTRAFEVLRVHEATLLRGWTSASERTATDPDEPLVTREEVLHMGIKRADLVRRRLLDAQTPQERQEWKDKAMNLSVSDLKRELAAERGMDVDAAWREITEYAARRLFAFGNRLMDARDRAAARAILDDVVACVAAVREQLEGSR